MASVAMAASAKAKDPSAENQDKQNQEAAQAWFLQRKAELKNIPECDGNAHKELHARCTEEFHICKKEKQDLNPVGNWECQIAHMECLRSCNTAAPVDTTAPETEVVSAPADLIATSDATIEVTSNEEDVRYYVSVDGAQFTQTGAVIELTGLADGAHTVEIKAVDAAGNEDATPALVAFTVDTTAPDTTITNVIIDGNNVQVDYVSTESVHSVKIDDGEWTAWDPISTSIFEGLADGEHIIYVRSMDDAGNIDATPAEYTFIVDTTAPETIIVSAPVGLVAANEAVVELASDEQGVSYLYSINGAEFAQTGATLTLSGLPEGNVTVEVKAVDAFGNVDQTPASASWAVDTIAPDTTITNLVIDGNAVTIDYVSTESVHSVKIDDGAWTIWDPEGQSIFSCLEPGEHTIYVRSMDDTGNIDETPAEQTFIIEENIVVAKLSPSDDLFSNGATLRVYPDQANLYLLKYPNGENIVYLKFETGAIPAGATIKSAKLQLKYLYVLKQSTVTEFGYTYHQVLGDWTESTFSMSSMPALAESFGTFTGGSAADTALTIDMMPLVSGWVAGSQSNYGMAIRLMAAGPQDTIRTVFASYEHADPAMRPVLEIEYAEPMTCTQ